MYAITCTYDSHIPTRQTWKYEDACDAFTAFLSFTDWGFAMKYSVINLEMPNGKMYTRTFYKP